MIDAFLHRYSWHHVWCLVLLLPISLHAKPEAGREVEAWWSMFLESSVVLTLATVAYSLFSRGFLSWLGLGHNTRRFVTLVFCSFILALGVTAATTSACLLHQGLLLGGAPVAAIPLLTVGVSAGPTRALRLLATILALPVLWFLVPTIPLLLSMLNT